MNPRKVNACAGFWLDRPIGLDVKDANTIFQASKHMRDSDTHSTKLIAHCRRQGAFKRDGLTHRSQRVVFIDNRTGNTIYLLLFAFTEVVEAYK